MLAGRYVLLGVGLAPLTLLSAARAQDLPPPETLETPYADAPVAPPPAPAQPPAAPAPPAPQPVRQGEVTIPPAPPPDTRPLRPIRAVRRLALTGEVGWNGLAGFGPVLTYYAHPHVALDIGAGISFLGWKAGARGRYNLLKTPVTPFIGAGFIATSGLGDVAYDPANSGKAEDAGRTPVTLNIQDSYFLQGVVGIDYVHRGGFTLIGSLGYARVLNRENVTVVEGTLDNDEERAIDVLFRSGPVITASVGYAFN